MGQSTDAYLFYGYAWTENTDELDFTADMDEWAERTLKTQGHTDPWDGYPERADKNTREQWMRDNNTAIDTWRDMKSQLTEAAGIDWDTHCSGDYPMPFLTIRGTHTTAWRGRPMPITSIETADDWRAKLDAFLAAEGIEPPEGDNQPGWWLASNWS